MKLKSLAFAALCSSLVASGAWANDRYGQRPPAVLSPDLTAPWVTQLRSPTTAHGAGSVVRQRRAVTSRQNNNRRARRAAVKQQQPAMNPVFLPTPTP